MNISALIPLLLGSGLGKHFFSRSNADAFRRLVIILLMVLALIALGRSIWV
jgi:uncharacterized membrane protein YfcA